MVGTSKILQDVNVSAHGAGQYPLVIVGSAIDVPGLALVVA
jgi:hypothetical protein